ncbi:MAG: hypothetical protein EA406_05830 [Rhodospirillales bacterium]|nr:MAG: hypothetical protein EA406_05830 [Rhodospirillales bacterium]
MTLAWPPGSEKPPQADPHAVLDAAAALDITEFELFRLAYRRWHATLPDERLLERAFADYMFRQRVPVWVRYLADEVARQRRLGTLNGEALGAGRFRDRPARPRGALILVSATAAVWFLLFAFLLQDVSTSRRDKVAMPTAPAPSCTTGSALHDTWAALLTGDPTLGCGEPFDTAGP